MRSQLNLMHKHKQREVADCEWTFRKYKVANCNGKKLGLLASTLDKLVVWSIGPRNPEAQLP
jgi:hypothetical protein